MDASNIANQKWSGEHYHLSEKKNYLKESLRAIASIALTVIATLMTSTAPGFHQPLRSKLVTLMGEKAFVITASLVAVFGLFGIMNSTLAMYFKYRAPDVVFDSAVMIATPDGTIPDKFLIKPQQWETKNEKIKLIDYFPQKKLESIFLCDDKNKVLFWLAFNTHKKIVEVTNCNPIGKINKYTQLILLSPQSKLEIDLKQRSYHFSLNWFIPTMVSE